MSFSTISKKVGKCRLCPPDSGDKYLTNGLCQYHYKLERGKVYLERQKEKNKVRKLIAAPENKVAVNERSVELKEWFKYHMANSPKICENCGASLKHYNEKDWMGSQDHIIEKSEVNGCPSVAAVLENHCVLGKWCGCHGQKHTSNLNLSRMPIFPLLKERFAKFEHLIAQEERKKIPNIFL